MSLLCCAGPSIRLCRTKRSSLSFPGFRQGPFATWRRAPGRVDVRMDFISIPSFLRTAWTLHFMQENLRRVRGAAACAIKAGAKIVSLGGFSSILIEGNFDMIPCRGDTVFTTGNSLTVAFIVSGIRKMCAQEGRDLSQATVLIVGATGDVGSGCVRCLLSLVSRMILCGRNMERLRRLQEELETQGVKVDVAPSILNLPARPDVVVCCASLPSPSLLLGELAPDALMCDAGYPKNLAPLGNKNGIKVFYGGLGQVTAGMTFATAGRRCFEPASLSRCSSRMSSGRDDARAGEQV